MSTKKPAKQKPRFKKARNVMVTIAEVRRMQKLLESRVEANSQCIHSLSAEIVRIASWLDRCVGPMIHRLALMGDWNLIKPEDGQRLMSIAGGELTPVYVEWYLATYGVEATRKKYGENIRSLPLYIRAKL